MMKKLLLIFLVLANNTYLLAQDSDDWVQKNSFEAPSLELSAKALLPEDEEPIPEKSAHDKYNEFKKKLFKNTGIAYRLDYSAAFMFANKSLGEKNAGSGMIRFFATWELLNRSKKNVGTLVFKGSHRHKYSAVSVKDFGFEIGYIGLQLPPFNNDGFRLTNLYWRQKLLNDNVDVSVGLLDVTDFVDLYMFANPWAGFMNIFFSTGSGSVYVPNDATLGISIKAFAFDNYYGIASITDAGSIPTKPLNTFNTFFTENHYSRTLELGWIESKDKFYSDNIHFTLWHSDGSDITNSIKGYGVSFSAIKSFNDKWYPFIRGGIAKDGGVLMQKSLLTGLAFRPSDGHGEVGLAAGWGQPSESSFGIGLRDQYSIELYYRLHINAFFEITPDIQLLINPALNTSVSSILVGGIRAKLTI